MDASLTWAEFFHNWPPELPHRGVLVTTVNEQIPFESFLLTNKLVMIQRRAPDAVGGRQVIIPFGFILAVKITDVAPAHVFAAGGFKAVKQKE